MESQAWGRCLGCCKLNKKHVLYEEGHGIGDGPLMSGPCADRSTTALLYSWEVHRRAEASGWQVGWSQVFGPEVSAIDLSRSHVKLIQGL